MRDRVVNLDRFPKTAPVLPPSPICQPPDEQPPAQKTPAEPQLDSGEQETPVGNNTTIASLATPGTGTEGDEAPVPEEPRPQTPSAVMPAPQQAGPLATPAAPPQTEPEPDDSIPPPYSDDRRSVTTPHITEEAFIQRIAALQADAVRANRALEEAREAAEMAQIAAAEAVTRLAALERREEARLALAVFERRDEPRNRRSGQWQFWRGRQ